MKKFWKILFAVIGCLGLFGLVCMVLGFCLGGAEQAHELLESESRGIVSLGKYQTEGAEVAAWPAAWPVIREDSYENLELATDDQISQISMEIDYARINIRESETDYYGIVAEYVAAAQYYREGDTLVIRTAKGNRKKEELTDLTLYIPAGSSLSLTEIEIGGGELMAENLHTDTLLIQAGAGQFVIEGLEADNAEIQVGAGNVEIWDGGLTKLVVETGAGFLSYRGNIEKEAEVICSMGAIYMEVAGREEDFDYETDSMLGNISVNGVSMEGRHEWRNGAGKQMELICSMGEIEVTFYED